MSSRTTNFEIRIDGHALVKASNGRVCIDGRNFHSDLKNLSSIIDILSDILDTAQEIRRPKLVSSK